MLLTISLFKFNVDADVFYAWLTKDLLPKLSEGTVIVMDNASFHKRQDIIQAGCIAEFLPPYSPDFNPIEHTWAQLKSIRNKMKCSIDELLALPLLVIFLLCISYN
jgi:transposase